MKKINTFHLINPSEEQFYIAMNLCVPNYQVPPISAHQYLEALKKHVTVHKNISTAVFYLGDKIYRNEYITVVNDMKGYPVLDSKTSVPDDRRVDHQLTQDEIIF